MPSHPTTRRRRTRGPRRGSGCHVRPRVLEALLLEDRPLALRNVGSLHDGGHQVEARREVRPQARHADVRRVHSRRRAEIGGELLRRRAQLLRRHAGDAFVHHVQRRVRKPLGADRSRRPRGRRCARTRAASRGSHDDHRDPVRERRLRRRRHDERPGRERRRLCAAEVFARGFRWRRALRSAGSRTRAITSHLPPAPRERRGARRGSCCRSRSSLQRRPTRASVLGSARGPCRCTRDRRSRRHSR